MLNKFPTKQKIDKFVCDCVRLCASVSTSGLL